MSIERRHSTASAAALVSTVTLLAIGCGENPQEPAPSEQGLSPGELSVELTVEPHHVHILETEAVFQVAVRRGNGEPVTDFETLEVERRLVSGQDWRGTECHLHGSMYEAHYVFTTSGEYQLRVRAEHPDWDEAHVLHEADETLSVARAHAEAGGYRIEFESFPGHAHEGESVALRFWVMEADADESGSRPPIEGLSPEAHVTESDGHGAEHPADEIEAGVYEADHTFDHSGASTIALHFTGGDGNPAEAEFELPIAGAH